MEKTPARKEDHKHTRTDMRKELTSCFADTGHIDSIQRPNSITTKYNNT